ncbi:MAG: SOS response-associated peptidase [Acidimicrobiales bacterium]
MCGRFAAFSPTGDLLERFGATAVDGVTDHVPSWNVAPSLEVRAVVERSSQGRLLAGLRWGLLPHWAEDRSVANRLTAARAETAAARPAFRQALSRRRAIVPADGFYEWKRVADGTRRGGRQPFWFTRRDGDVVALGALWETWRHPDGGLVRTVCLLTTAANSDLEGVHDRMPLILEPDEWDQWLDPGQRDTAALAPLMIPRDQPRLQRHPVNARVNKAESDGPELIEPLTTGAEGPVTLPGG